MTPNLTLTLATATEITAADGCEDDYQPPRITTPGRILFQLISIDQNKSPTYRYETEVLDYDGDTGVFWISEGVGFDYWFDWMIDLQEPGFYVLEGVRGHWIRGDGWTTDDDEKWEFDLCRRATPDEIAGAALDDLPSIGDAA